MNSQPIEVASFAGDLTPVGFLLIEPCPGDPDVVADGDGEAIDDVDRGRIEAFEELPPPLDNGEKQFPNDVQTTVEAAFAEHPGDVTALAEQFSCSLPVAGKVQG